MPDDAVFLVASVTKPLTATAAVLLRDPPARFSLLSAHKYIPPVMEIVAEMPETRVEGFLAAGHAASITGWAVFEPFVARHGLPVAIGGFEPLDLLAGFAALVERIRIGRPGVDNCFPRMVTREGIEPPRPLWAPGAIHSTVRRGDWIYELTDPLRYEEGFLVEVRRAPRGEWRAGSGSPFYVVQGATAGAALDAARGFVLEHG